MSNYSFNLKFLINLFFLFILILYVKDVEIINVFHREVHTEYLNNPEGIKLNLRNYNGHLIAHILSLDGKIKVENITQNNLKRINYYNYDAYYISNYDDQSFVLNIFSLNLLLKEGNQNRNYPLIINNIYNRFSFDYEDAIYYLNINENEPVFLYFNEDFLIRANKVRLNCKFKISNFVQPIIVSFFIKEKKNFKIEIQDETNRTINYKEYIIIKPNYKEDYNILITQKKEDILNTTMIINIIQNISSPIYLLKNQLNLGFIPIEVDYYYYYMEVLRGEEGEIILFNKRQNGVLISKIIKKNNKKLEINEFPKYNESNFTSKDYLEFNIYNQKLNFNSSHTEKCENGCFLLITYYSNIPKSLDIIGTEFSILGRIWDEEEFKSQIINIPLDEYIFSYFDETTVNIHYYSIFIPFEAETLYLELHGMNILGYYKEGITQINTQKITNNTKKLFDEYQNKMIIKLNPEDIGLGSFKEKYISFAFEKNNKNIHSYYYFRILEQKSENDYVIYPLDTKKENYCETKENKCYFLLKNEPKGLSNKILIYSYGKNNVSYQVFYMNDTDYYSSNFNLSNLNKSENIESFNGLLSLDLKLDDQFILIVVESIEDENLTIVSNFYNESNSSSIDIDIYSYQLYHLSENQWQQFNLNNSLTDYRILINNTEGEGYICFSQSCDNTNSYIHIAEQKIYSFSTYNKTSFFIYPKNHLTLLIKIIYEISNEEIKELNYQQYFDNITSNKSIFPLIYFFKDVKYNGININFIFKFNDSNNAINNLIIKGYGLDYSQIISIKDKNEMIDFTNEIKGKYDNLTNCGTIELRKELIQTEYNDTYKYTEDKYFMIIIENISPFEYKNIKNDIYVFSKDENKIFLPKNKYIKLSFNLLENKIITKKYYLEIDNITNKFILEYSSNYEFINLTFNNSGIKNNPPKTKGGFKQYTLLINAENSDACYFNIEINPTNNIDLDKALKEANLIIKYYNEEKSIDTNYFYNNSFRTERKKNKGNFSDYKLIINCQSEINNSPNDLNYIYYLRLIRKKDILNNEELNTIAQISSHLLYINQYTTTNPYKEFYFNLTNLENNEVYIASLFIKVENKSKGEETYYSTMYEFSTELEIEQKEQNKYINYIVIIVLIILIIILFISFIIWRKMKIKNSNLENKVNAIDFSSGINDDLINKKELSEKKNNESYINTFI